VDGRAPGPRRTLGTVRSVSTDEDTDETSGAGTGAAADAPGSDHGPDDGSDAGVADWPDAEQAPDDPDDLAGARTPMSRFASRWGRVLAAVLALLLAVPVGGWLVDELAFGISGRAVESEVGDAALTEAILLVRSVDCAGRVSTGSAFGLLVDGRKVVVTNRHVVADARATSVRPLEGGPAIRVEGHRLADSADVAVLELPPDTPGTALPVARPARAGDEVRTVGFPGARPATTSGRVLAVEGGIVELDLVVDPGASGSPVTDGGGGVVAQVFARTEDGRGIATEVTHLLAAIGEARPGPGC
jgi:S1-C subfamily serine protease